MTTSTDATYTYRSLELTYSYRIIRLFESSGDFNAPLRCQLVECSDPKSNPYEALSYVWGTEDAKDILHIQQTDNRFHYDRLKIKPNLHNALRYLRLKNEPQSLWVDAVCINQQDEREQSRQVARMGEIYRQATCAVVWLGTKGGLGPIFQKRGREWLETVAKPLQPTEDEDDSDSEATRADINRAITELRYTLLESQW